MTCFVSALSDLNHKNSVFGLDNSPLKRDHCDLLLDAIDAQLSQLQVYDFYSVCLYVNNNMYIFRKLAYLVVHVTSNI